MTKTDEELQKLLKQVVDHFDNEDRAVRYRQIRTYRKLKLYWNSFSNIWYSEVAHDWRIPDTAINENDNEQAYYDKPVNVFRAYLESIIAALSVTVPMVRCIPDDADNPLDMSTAKTGDKIAELVYKHNDVILVWIHALYIYCTEGMVACYSYPKEDEKYGTWEEKHYEDVEELQPMVCPTCGSPLDAELFTAREEDEYMPGDDDIITHDAIFNQGMILCPNCAAILDPEMKPEHQIVSRLTGITKHPKSRQCIEIYGGLYIKVANWAKKQEDTPYLIYSYETHYANVVEKYPDLADEKNKLKLTTSSGVYEPYEQWARLNPEYRGEYPINNVTVRNCWLRPASFNVLCKEDADKLKKAFPDGAKAIFANELFAYAENECLDDCWTLTKNPLSDFINHDPLGLLLVSVQDITNDLISLVLQTIEHGITQTFVDPQTLNLDQYKQLEVSPGSITNAKAKSGKGLSESFHEIKTATLSGEVLPFGEMIQGMGQLVSGALPSLFGGVQEGGSKTASQYAMSRSQALQRLQTPWKMLTIWWKTIFGKVITSYIKEVKEDERFVQKDEQGNFVNVFIRKADLAGKIGSVELEADENLPVTWNQKKDAIMALMQAGNPLIMEALTSPENIPFIKEAIGLNEFIIPGEDDRQKQYEEIQQLLVSEPIVLPADPMMAEQQLAMGVMPQDLELPSVEIDPDLDNHEIEADICRRWLVSEAGRLAKTENPQGYKNVLLHYKAHVQVITKMMMAQQSAGQQTEGAESGEKPPGKEKQGPENQGLMKQAPIGEDNAQ